LEGFQQNQQHLLAEVRGVADRLEVLDGPTGRRSWPDDVKARIVAESYERGARVCDVARRNGITPQHLSSWRGLARRGKLALPDEDGALFAALEIEAEPTAVSGGRIEIVCGDVVIRFPGDVPSARVAEIAVALRGTR